MTLPYGYKTFSGDSGTTSADNTQDSISVTGDNWINTLVENDSIKLSHKKSYFFADALPYEIAG